ncbi:multidrug efflux pump subunit AcrB [Bacteroidales bacterium 6E]|nr:multidrug efflux pump subunit AcrB [Bacteroidales bacterium 6E]
MQITELVFRKKAIFYFLMVAIVIGGILSFRSISKLEDPEIVIMQARVVTIYPGASAHEVELQVTDILENELNTLSDLNLIMSKSEDNVSMITVELEMTVPQDEIQQRWEFMRRKVAAAARQMPAGAQPPIVIDDFGDVYGMFYAMTAKDFPYEEMNRHAEYVKREMLDVEGVNRVQIYGKQTPVANIIISTETMGRMGVFPIQIMSAIAGQNKVVYPGVLESGDQMIRVDVSDEINDIDDLRNIMIQGVQGDQFRLGDIATIENDYAKPLRNTMYVNNEKALAISISMESGENILNVGQRVESRLAEIQNYLPAGIEFEKVFFQPDKVRDSINGFMWNLVASVAIVVIVLMITMGLRSGLIIGAGLVLTVLATFPILLVADGTLQRISLGAFIVAMGMLVDNAIVVIDGILVDLHRGTDRPTALTRSARRTAWPLLGATLIAVTAFLPVYLSKDTAGTYARDLFVVLCISLLISWILALTQVPLFAGKFLKVKPGRENSHSHEGEMYKVIRSALSFLINHKIPTIAVATILMLLAGLNVKNIKNTFFPDFNYNQVYIEYILPDGTNPTQVNNDLHQITDHLLGLPEVQMVVSSHGMTPSRYCLVRAIGEAGDNYGELIVNFEDYPTMVHMKPILEQYLNANFPDAYIRIRKYNLSIKASHTVEVEFRGPDPAILHDLSRRAQEIMHRNPYTDKYTIGDDWNPMGKSLVAQYSQQLASRAGISRSDVSNALLAATSGIPLGNYYDGQTEYGILLKTRNSDGSIPQKLDDIPVWGMLPSLSGIQQDDVQDVILGTKTIQELTGEVIKPQPLSAVTMGTSLEWEETLVRRTNGQRSIQAQCDPIEGASPAQVRKSMMEDIEAIDLPPGYTYEWVGEFELQKSALKNIFSYLPVSIMLILLILMLLFNDVKKPLIVLAVIPLTAIGIVPGLVLTGSPFTFMAIVGAIGLLGMLIKNSIVLLDEIEKQIGEGIPRYTALVQATMSRTRPVIMASLTTILGMLPLFTDPMYSSMAVTIISGLLIGTIITLIFVPILYAFFFHIDKHETEHPAPSTPKDPSNQKFYA